LERRHYNPYGLRNDVKRLAGAACFVELALGARSWSSRAIEDWLRHGAISKDAETPTNMVRPLLQGRLPSTATAKKIASEHFACRLLRWRDHPLWTALQPTDEIIHQSLLDYTETLGFDVASLLLGKRTFEHVDTMLEEDIALGAVDILTAMTVASVFYSPPGNNTACYGTWRLFPATVGGTPHLFIRWRELLELFNERIWTYGEARARQDAFGLGRMRVEIHRCADEARSEGVRIPPDKLTLFPSPVRRRASRKH